MILNLFDRMKLPFRKNKEFLSALYDILGFYPHNIEIYRIAFSHKSLRYRRDADSKKGGKDRKANNRDRKQRSENTSKPLNNERLEYLGDAVLETIVSDILFHHFPHKREGFLTSTRSKIVQREALNRLAADMGLEKLILAAQGTRMSHTNIGGNAFEALSLIHLGCVNISTVVEQLDAYTCRESCRKTLVLQLATGNAMCLIADEMTQ